MQHAQSASSSMACSAKCLLVIAACSAVVVASPGSLRGVHVPPGVILGGDPDVREVAIHRVYPLKAGESVFAYARPDPTGRSFAYSSQMLQSATGQAAQVEHVVDIASGRVLFSGPGMDAYWAPDGQRLIFLRLSLSGSKSVAVWHMGGRLSPDVAPVELGDYFSWGLRDGRDEIMTIDGNYYALVDDKAVLPGGRIAPCPGFGADLRPLVSKDGRRVTVFQSGHVVVRSVDDCNGIFDTGLAGAKADFSWDGRYVAFHVPKPDDDGFRIAVVDTRRRTVRFVPGLIGSGFFPSWTRDGRLFFRYEGPDYDGFMMATNVLSIPEESLPRAVPGGVRPDVHWSDVFASSEAARSTLVMVWSDWSAHSPAAMNELSAFAARARDLGMNVSVRTAALEGSRRSFLGGLFAEGGGPPEVNFRRGGAELAWAVNQIPTELLFRDGALIAEALGPRDCDSLSSWVTGSLSARAGERRDH